MNCGEGATSSVVSVVMPAYNAESTIAHSVESILAQDHESFELIVVNDGSTDRTREIAEAYLADSRVRVVNKRNEGIVSALNCGISLARGRYIARADADDWYDKSRLSAQVGYLDRNPDVAMVATDFVKIYDDGTGVEVTQPDSHGGIVHGLFIANNVMHSSVMYRLDAFRAAGGYREEWRHVEDWDLWFRLAQLGRLAIVSSPLSYFRIHDVSVSAVKEMEQTRLGLRLRWQLLASGQYSAWYSLYLLKPVLKYIVGSRILRAYRALSGARR